MLQRAGTKKGIKLEDAGFNGGTLILENENMGDRQPTMTFRERGYKNSRLSARSEVHKEAGMTNGVNELKDELASDNQIGRAHV